MDYEAAAVYRDRLGAIDAVLAKSALVLARRHRRRPVRHRRGRAQRGRAAVRDPRRPRARCARDDDREGARHLRRRARRPGPPARVRRCRARRHPPSGARAVDARRRRPSSRSGCASGAASSCRSRSPSAVARRICCRTATLNAQQALIVHKTRRTSDYVARYAGPHRPAGGTGPRRGAAADRVLRRLAPRRHERRRVDGRLRRRAAAQRPVPLVRRARDHRRHRLDLSGSDAPARIPRPARRAGRARAGADARTGRSPRPASGRASPTRRSCSSSTAASPRSRPPRALSPTPGTTRSRCAASRSGSRRCGCRGRSTR